MPPVLRQRPLILSTDWCKILCDGPFPNIDEFRREGDPILFAHGRDPYHHAHSNLLDAYVRLQEAGLLQCRHSLAPEDPFSISDASSWATADAESVFTDLTPNSVRRKVRTKAKAIRLHPTLVGWYLLQMQLRTGTQVWLAVPSEEFRWA